MWIEIGSCRSHRRGGSGHGCTPHFLHARAQKLTIRGAEIRGDGCAEHHHRHREVDLQVGEFVRLTRLGTDGTHEFFFVQLAIAVGVPSADVSAVRYTCEYKN